LADDRRPRYGRGTVGCSQHRRWQGAAGSDKSRSVPEGSGAGVEPERRRPTRPRREGHNQKTRDGKLFEYSQFILWNDIILIVIFERERLRVFGMNFVSIAPPHYPNGLKVEDVS